MYKQFLVCMFLFMFSVVVLPSSTFEDRKNNMVNSINKEIDKLKKYCENLKNWLEDIPFEEKKLRSEIRTHRSYCKDRCLHFRYFRIAAINAKEPEDLDVIFEDINNIKTQLELVVKKGLSIQTEYFNVKYKDVLSTRQI